jgi:glutathione S-transferase
MPARLVTIPFSHYCEKARWALDRARVDYVEDPHVPMFAWGPALRRGRSRTVPVLVADDEVLAESHDILAWVHRRAPEVDLYPTDIAGDVEQLEDVFDRKVGPAARRLAYHALMKDRGAVQNLFVNRAPAWEIAATRTMMPIMLRMMKRGLKRGLKIDDAGAARSETQLAPVLADVESRLEKTGGPWLFGDRFTAADVTFASLMTPLVVPPSFADAHLCPRMLESEPARSMVARHRETAAGRFVLRAYEKERHFTAA